MSPARTSRSSKHAAETTPAKLTFEQAIDELETIIEHIEQGEIGLEESLAQYRRGAALLKRCRGILDTAQQQVEELTAGEGDAKES